MTIRALYFSLKRQQPNLSQADIYELLEFIFQKDYQWIVDNFELSVPQKAKVLANECSQKLKQGLPVAYVIQKKDFFQDSFFVDERVLIPRPESEVLIEAARSWLETNPNAQVLDLGTGSGILGLTIKKLYPRTTVYLSDISSSALDVAKTNGKIKNLDVNYLAGDFLEPATLMGLKFDLIICNPPYIATDDKNIQQSTKFEPQNALFAKNKGLEFYEKLFSDLFKVIANPENFCVVMEFGWQQKQAIEQLAHQHFYKAKFKISFLKDYSNYWRCIIIRSEN